MEKQYQVINIFPEHRPDIKQIQLVLDAAVEVQVMEDAELNPGVFTFMIKPIAQNEQEGTNDA